MIYHNDLVSQWPVDPFCFNFVSVGSVCKYRYKDIVLHQKFIFIINECNDCSRISLIENDPGMKWHCFVKTCEITKIYHI